MQGKQQSILRRSTLWDYFPWLSVAVILLSIFPKTQMWVHSWWSRRRNLRLSIYGFYDNVTMLSQVPAPLFLSYCTFKVLPAVSALRKTHSNSNASNAKPMAFALSHTSVPTSGTISSKLKGTRLLSLPSKANSEHSSSPNISVKLHCPSSL